MIQQRKPPTHFCFVVGDYVLEEIGGKAYLSSVSNQASPTYEFSNGLGTLLTDSLTLEVFDAVLAHLKKFNRTTFPTSFQQAVFAATMKEPTAEMEYGKRLKQAFAAVAATGLMVVPVIQLAHSLNIISSAPKSAVVAAAANTDKSDKGEETDEKKEDEEIKEEGGSYCSDNPKAKGCEVNEDGDVGMRV